MGTMTERMMLAASSSTAVGQIDGRMVNPTGRFLVAMAVKG